jgi:predicted kinase
MKIQVLVGMIASGKSTYARNAAKSGVICMNDDAIVNMLHADDYTLYDKSLKILYKTIENQIIGTALAMKRVVLVDRGLNVSRRGRRRWLAMAQSYDVPCEAIVFNNEGPEIHAKRRTDCDPRGHDYSYWLDCASHHFREYTEPSLGEGFTNIHFVTFDDIQRGKVFA